MHKRITKFLVLILAIAMAVTAFTGCSKKGLDGNISGDITSNGGFVVQKGEYVYFINGVDDYDAENNGSVVKSALMRIKTSSLNEGKYADVDTVVDSLLVAGSYKTGICIFGDYVYYATPTNTKDKDGKVENSYLDFKRTKLDGTDTTYFCRAESKTADYSFVEIAGVVYIVRVVSEQNDAETNVNSIYSFNTSTKVDTRLVYNVENCIFYTDVASNNPFIYYTMKIYKDKSTSTEGYNQLYRVSVDATTAQYGDAFNYDANVDENKNKINDYTYVNYGSLILDGIGKINELTDYNFDKIKGQANSSTVSAGFTYSLVKYDNNGLYYTRAYVDSTDMDGNTTYKLKDNAVTAGLTAGTWNAVTENYTASSTSHIVISYVDSAISETTYFYTEGEDEHFINVDSNGQIVNTKVTDGSKLTIATDASSATLMYTQDGDNGLKYLYYSVSGAIYRAVYNGTAENYNTLIGNKDYKAVQIYDIKANTTWYNSEVVGGRLYFVNADSDAYSYVYTINLAGKTNSQIEEMNDIYQATQDALAELDASSSDIKNAVKYYYLSEDTALFKQYNVNSNYSQYQNSIFDSFVNAQDFSTFKFSKLKTGDTKYNVRSAFVNMIGTMSESDLDTQETTLNGYLTSLKQGDNGLGWMVWLAVGVGSFLAILTVTLVILRQKRILY